MAPPPSRPAGAGPAVRLWARSELARRWRALIALGVIAGLAGGLALAAAAGARRTATAYDRFRHETAAPDALLFATLVGVYDQDYSAVTKLPEVVSAGSFTLAPVGVVDPPMGSLPPADDQLYRTLGRPLLIAGRLPNPDQADEIVVNRRAAVDYDLDVGEQVTVSSSTDITQEGPPSGGPELQATIVGIGDSTIDLIFFADEAGFTPGAALLERFSEVPRAPNLVVRLRPGTDVAAFRHKAATALSLPDLPIRDLGEDRKRITHSTDLEKAGLWLFSAAVVLAGLVLVGQALARTVYAMAESVPTLRAVGLTAADLVKGLMLPVLVTAATGAVVAVGSAVAASGRFPVGLGRRLEPDPGIHADWLVLALGAVALAVLVLAGSAAAAFRASRPRAARPTSRAGSHLVRAIRRVVPLPVAVGAGLALESGRGERSLPTRPAVAAAVSAVLGVLGALGLVHGIDDAVSRPGRSGQVWDAAITPQANEDGPTVVPDSLLADLERHPDVDRITMLTLTPLDVEGTGLPVFTLEPERGDLSFVVLHGRAPSGPDEVTIGPATAKAMGKSIGDRLGVGDGDGPGLRIVGTALLPQTPHSSFDQGVWITPAGLSGLGERNDDSDGEETLLVTARGGATPEALVAALGRDIEHVEIEPPATPQDVLALRNVRTLPQALAVFLVLLGLAGLGHALATAARRRRHDLAVLRALGFRPRQSAACIAWQAMTVAVVGLLAGIPFGVVVGRRAWQWVADATPLLYVPPLAALAAVLAVPAALAAANILAVLPARRVARLRPADDLRSD